jgi:hypothetical protein
VLKSTEKPVDLLSEGYVLRGKNQMSYSQAAKTKDLHESLGCPPGQATPCKVETLVDEALFVEAAHAFLCYNRTSFGDSYICRCPSRKEIYKRSGR